MPSSSGFDENGIFVSYSHRDSERIKAELDWLDSSGFNVWYDDSITPGAVWSNQIAEAIQKSALTIYFVTPRSVTSEHCMGEVSYALDNGHRVLVVFLERAVLLPGLALRLNATQAILAYELDEDTYRHRLATTIESFLAARGAGHENVERPIEHRLAVLPFETLSSNPEHEFLGQGLAEDLLNALVRANTIPVISRTSVFQLQKADLRTMARQLGASHVLEGSIRGAGTRLRITVRLFDASQEVPLWSQRYDRDSGDVFLLQDELADEIASQLDDTLPSATVRRSRAVAARNFRAYELFLEGNHLLNVGEPQTLKQAEAVLLASLEIDPTFVDARVDLGVAYLRQMGDPIGLILPKLAFEKANAAFRRALDLEPGNARAIGWQGYTTINGEHDWNRGFAYFERSLAINESDAHIRCRYGWFLFMAKRPDGRRHLERAFLLDPVSMQTTYLRSIQLLIDGKIKEGVRLIETLLLRQPDSHATNWYVAYVNALVGAVDNARRHIDHCIQLVGDRLPPVVTILAMIAERQGDPQSSWHDQIFERSEAEYFPLTLDLYWPKERLETMWERAHEQRSTCLLGPRLENRPPNFDPDRWQVLQEKLGRGSTRIGRASRLIYTLPTDQEALRQRRLQLSAETLREYAGVYRRSDGGHSFSLTASDGNLIFDEGRGSTESFLPIAPDEFHSILTFYRIRFVRAQGRVVRTELRLEDELSNYDRGE